ncbi:MAG: DUF4381 family protein [Verrucomicrobia bacterium]|jgi:hypothetical protein|nr:DUF4381 family protein [Verrucomicrobiota bacterium]
MILAQAQAPQLPPLPEGPSLDRVRGPVDIPAYEPWQIALAALFVLCFLGLIVWAILRSRKKQTPPLPPYETALAELDAAVELTEGDDERFAMLTSAALRRYLEMDLGLHFTARTSQEFLLSLKKKGQLNETFQEQLSDVLAAFDRIKFARSSIAPEERRHISDKVRRLIEEAHTIANKEGRET